VAARPVSEWVVSETDAGTRLDKFLAAADRIGSRGKVVTALERGKVFLNEVECTLADASTRLVVEDVVRVWMDRPGSATRRPGRTNQARSTSSSKTTR
jgi:ribosomal 50S subunit-recycling heat shock protein